jgi:hypothetical protein
MVSIAIWNPSGIARAPTPSAPQPRAHAAEHLEGLAKIVYLGAERDLGASRPGCVAMSGLLGRAVLESGPSPVEPLTAALRR